MFRANRVASMRGDCCMRPRSVSRSCRNRGRLEANAAATATKSSGCCAMRSVNSGDLSIGSVQAFPITVGPTRVTTGTPIKKRIQARRVPIARERIQRDIDVVVQLKILNHRPAAYKSDPIWRHSLLFEHLQCASRHDPSGARSSKRDRSTVRSTRAQSVSIAGLTLQ